MAEDNKITNRELLKKEANLLKKEENLLKKQESITSSQKNINKTVSDKEKLLQKQEDLLVKKKQLFNEEKKQNRKSVSQTQALQKIIDLLKKQNSEKGTMKSKVNANSQEKVKMGEGVADILTKIYGLLKKRDDQERDQKEIEKDFEKQKEKDSDKGKSSKASTASKIAKSKDTGFSWEDILLGLGLFLVTKFFKPISEVLGVIKDAIVGAWNVLKDVKNFVFEIAKKMGIGPDKLLPTIPKPTIPDAKKYDKTGKPITDESLKGKSGNRPTSNPVAGTPESKANARTQYESLSIDQKTRLAEQGIWSDETTGPNAGRLYKRSTARGMQGEKVYLSESQSKLAMSKIPGGAMMAKTKADIDKLKKQYSDFAKKVADFWKKISESMAKMGFKVPSTIQQMNRAAWSIIKNKALKIAGKTLILVNIGISIWNLASMMSYSWTQATNGAMSWLDFSKRLGFAIEELGLIISESVIGGIVGGTAGGAAGLATGPAAPVASTALAIAGSLAGSYGAVELMESTGANKFILRHSAGAFMSDEDFKKMYSDLGLDSEQTTSMATGKFSDLSESDKEKFLNQQGVAEGMNKTGSVAQRHNNPGNITWTKDGIAQKYGAVEGDTVKDPSTGQSHTFAKFPTLEAGKMAQRALWESKRYADKPFEESLRTWSDPSNRQAFSNYKSTVLKGIATDSSSLSKPEDKVSMTPTPKVETKKLDDKSAMNTISSVINNITHNNNVVSPTQGSHGSGGNQASVRNSEPTLMTAMYKGINYATT
jgi:hypothetical protein